MNNEEEVDEIMQYRKEFMEFLRETNFIEIMTHEDIESALIVARGWLNNQKTYFQSARYGQKQFVKFVATQFCWRMKDKQIELLEKALELACYDMTRSLFPNKWQQMIPTMVEQYKEDAKEIFKSENWRIWV